MFIPREFQTDVEALPPVLRVLLEDELAAGNEIREVSHTHPAPPSGACIFLAKPVRTRARTTADGLQFRERNSSLYAGEFTDERGEYYLVDPPETPARQQTPSRRQPSPAPDDAVRRFERSMIMDYEKWRDGIGYDLDTLRCATPTEQERIEHLLLTSGVNNWRDVEALAELNTPRARAALQKAIESADASIRMAVIEHAPDLVPLDTRIHSLLQALETAQFHGGLTAALDEAAELHPPEVVRTLLRGTLRREGSIAVHFAALLLFIHGQASEPFDDEQRPFFLRFNAERKDARENAFRELCARIGVNASDFLSNHE